MGTDIINSKKSENNTKKVLCGMSGGVDSSVSALMLQNMGFSVEGFTMQLFNKNLTDSGNTSKNDVSDAKSVCDKLNIKHRVLNYETVFKEKVINKFIESYVNGLTPNPCLYCNKNLKFGKMLNDAEALGFDYIATGHYAKIEKSGSVYYLKKATDLSKDQSYVLYMLNQKTLSKIIFPLGNLTKKEVRKIAEENNFVNADKGDSQDICFVPSGKYVEFILKQGVFCKTGNYLDVTGKVIGKHKGIINYTIGQRKGLGITFGKPAFVLNKNAKTNTVTLGSEDYLFTKTVKVKDVNFTVDEKLTFPLNVTAKLRYRAEEAKAKLILGENEREYILEFAVQQRAVTPGQAAVFYLGDVVLGGGEIY